ncbi:unnamed protein product [Alopecurus aequalis]
MAQATRPLHLGGVGLVARRHPPLGPLGFRPTGSMRRATALVAAAAAAKGKEATASAAVVVREFYDGVNRRDLAAVAPLIAEGCVYEDLVFPRPMVGRDNVVGFFGEFMGSVSPDLRFVIDDISGDDPAAVGVTWHLGTPNKIPIFPLPAAHLRLRCLNFGAGLDAEWKGRPFPFSRGCSFYRCQPDPRRPQQIQIVYGRDCVEPATKPGELALVAIRGVTWILERFPSLADRL